MRAGRWIAMLALTQCSRPGPRIHSEAQPHVVNHGPRGESTAEAHTGLRGLVAPRRTVELRRVAAVDEPLILEAAAEGGLGEGPLLDGACPRLRGGDVVDACVADDAHCREPAASGAVAMAANLRRDIRSRP